MGSYLIKVVLCMLLLISWPFPTPVNSATEISQQSFSSVSNSLTEKCQVSDAAREAIDKAWEQEEKTSEVIELILQAETAVEPPECDGVRAKILAEKAIKPSNAATFPDQNIGDVKNDQTSDPMDLKNLLIVEGVLAATFLITANDPEAWGKFLIITSPIVLGDVESKTDYWAAVALTAAYGIWLADQEDEDESELFRKQFLTLNAFLIPFWIYKKVSDTDKSEEQTQLFLETDPVNYGLKLNYTFRF